MKHWTSNNFKNPSSIYAWQYIRWLLRSDFGYTTKEHVIPRVLCLEQQKTLYVPVPRLQKGFLNRLELPEGETGPAAIRKAVSRNGMESYGKPIGKSITWKI